LAFSELPSLLEFGVSVVAAELLRFLLLAAEALSGDRTEFRLELPAGVLLALLTALLLALLPAALLLAAS